MKTLYIVVQDWTLDTCASSFELNQLHALMSWASVSYRVEISKAKNWAKWLGEASHAHLACIIKVVKKVHW